MKNISSTLQEHLDSGSTTMCYCWKLTRRDGTVQGFTEHDRNLTFDGQEYLASSGFTASQVSQTLGLSVDNLEIEGALSADTINEDDLLNGMYDDADVELYWVNWQDADNIEMRVVITKGNLGEVKRGQVGFTAEVRSIAHRLNEKTGRTYQKVCDARIGDSRCGVNLNTAAFTGTGTVDSSQNRIFTVSGLSGYDPAWFDSGLLTFTSGSNQQGQYEVKRFTRQGSVDTIELWFAPPYSVLSGDAFSVSAGCGKDASTCRNKFNNIRNFRGFPFMPGNDTITSYPVRGEGGQGRSLFD